MGVGVGILRVAVRTVSGVHQAAVRRLEQRQWLPRAPEQQAGREAALGGEEDLSKFRWSRVLGQV